MAATHYVPVIMHRSIRLGRRSGYDGYCFLCQGKEKVTAEMALSFTAYNLRRAISIVGVQACLCIFDRRRKETERKQGDCEGHILFFLSKTQES